MNMKYKILFVGIGSIARRHIKNLAKLSKSEDMEFQIDALRSKSCIENKNEEYILNTFYNYEDISDDYDIIFITNPTQLHYQTLKMLIHKSKTFFIEKPIFDYNALELPHINTDEKLIYVACPLRYHPIIEYVKQNIINRTEVLTVRSICSSYLPEWRKEVDYRKIYSAEKDSGGVGLDLIHEWDYLSYLFGMPNKIYTIQNKVSNLDIDSNDLAVYIAEYTNMVAELHLDYFGRFPRREFELYTESDIIVADIINSNIRYLNEGVNIDIECSRDEYQTNELKHFFSIVRGECDNTNNAETAVNTMLLTKGDVI